jgi:hypothetical protein
MSRPLVGRDRNDVKAAIAVHRVWVLRQPVVSCRYDSSALLLTDGGKGLIFSRTRLDLDKGNGAAAPYDQINLPGGRFPATIKNTISLDPQHDGGANLCGVTAAFSLLMLA